MGRRRLAGPPPRALFRFRRGSTGLDQALGRRLPPRLLEKLSRRGGPRLSEPHDDHRIGPVVVRQEERRRIRFEQNIAVHKVDLDRDGLAVLAQTSQDPSSDLERRRSVARALFDAGEAGGPFEEGPPGNAALRTRGSGPLGRSRPARGSFAPRHRPALSIPHDIPGRPFRPLRRREKAQDLAHHPIALPGPEEKLGVRGARHDDELLRRRGGLVLRADLREARDVPRADVVAGDEEELAPGDLLPAAYAPAASRTRRSIPPGPARIEASAAASPPMLAPTAKTAEAPAFRRNRTAARTSRWSGASRGSASPGPRERP